MSLKQYIFIFTVLYLECEARNKNYSLDQVKGSWVISNASENAIPFIGECPSVVIEASPKKFREKSSGQMLLKIHKMTYTFTIVAMDQSTYQVYNSESLPLANLSILTAESNAFLVLQVKRDDETYYAVLTNENKRSEKTDKKLWKFWNSNDSTKNVPLLPIKQENCGTTEGRETYVENNAMHITSITIEDTYVSDQALEYESPIDNSDNKMQGISSKKPEVTTETASVIRPRITIKLGGSTTPTTPMETSSTTPSTNKTQSLPSKKTNDDSIKIDGSFANEVLPNLIIVLLNVVLLVII
ncbi:hypothetical protein WA026_005024 [Henosepilachna vigintioctopunctata]|uniref:Uncharacterized protein n=1 Tax=Henosepilachna vigintioctopunctata TaxID=420089 RepID=A0AAW1USQ5_9CUCU